MEVTDKSITFLNKIMLAKYKTCMIFHFLFNEIMINLWISFSLKKTSWAVENIPWISSSQDNVKDHQCSFYNTYRFSKHNTYKFLYYKDGNTYTVPTLVLTRVCRPWMMNHVDTPTTFSKLTSPKQPQWSEITVSSYAASNTGRL